MATYFETAAKASGQAKLASNWVMGEVSRRVNTLELGFEVAVVTPEQLSLLIGRIHDGTISHNAARQVFDALWNQESGNVDAVIEAKGLRQMNDSSALEKIIDAVLASNADNVAQYRAGKEKAFNALVGQAMKASQGKANPAQIHALLKTKLS
jgi:aspartyl-tRNA(Asn)/glutamyl-tRNA(Gln) amidotransferase subunit B